MITSPVLSLQTKKRRSPSKKTKTLEEKITFQLNQLTLLKEKLSAELYGIEQNLILGGEFRQGECLDDDYLKRWLRVRCWNVAKAAEALCDHASWRVAYCPHRGRIQTVTIQKELRAGKIFLQGLDRMGRPLVVALAAQHSTLNRDATEMERFICYTLDRQLDVADVTLNPQRQICVLFDLTDIGLTAIDPTAMHQIYAMFSQHFVERLGMLFIYNAPVIFWATWKGFSKILSKASLDKIHFVYPKDLTALHREVPLTVLPKRYQGSAELIPIDQF